MLQGADASGNLIRFWKAKGMLDILPHRVAKAKGEGTAIIGENGEDKVGA